MHTYADPRACPSCRASLSDQQRRCTTCDLSLEHPLIRQVFAGLQHVDALVAQMRATPQPVPAPAPSPGPSPAPSPAPVPAPMTTRGVRTSSVPAILLGLGALCLLVAAVAFLAVAWSWLGVGGRTAVLVGLTLVTGSGGVVLARRGLRVAAESLVTVSLGLVALDVVGADSAGWWGDLSGAGLTALVGLVVAMSGGVVVALDRRLAAPQVLGVLGLYLSSAVLPVVVGHDLAVAGLAALTFGTLGAVAWMAGLRVAAWVAVAVAGISWLDLAGSSIVSLGQLDRLTVAALWTDGSGPSLAAAAALLLGPLAVTRRSEIVLPLATLSACVLTGVAALPVLDDGATRIALASLTAGVVWTLVGLVRRALVVAGVTSAVSLVPAVLVAVTLGGQAVGSVLQTDAALRLSPGTPLAEPLLTVPVVLALLALGFVLLRPHLGRAVLIGGATTVALAGVATLALHPVPLWTVVAALGVLGTALGLDALARAGSAGLVQLIGAGVVLGAAAVAALPSATLLTAPTALLSALAAAAVLVGRCEAADEVGGLVLPIAVSALLWTACEAIGVDAADRAVPVLVLVGLLAMARPRFEVELPAGLTGFVASCVAIPQAGDATVSLAVHLTVAGALVSIQALLHPDRRPLAWAGGALLVLATWVRLADLGVEAPEAYTLPTAAVLTLVGLRHLLRDPHAPTGTTLLPGLVLATVPTLLFALANDPVSLRGLLLGAACLALVLGGTHLRWSAPLLVGAVVGGVLTLAELQPYAAQTPQWIAIGLAGTTLVLVGITWERRVVDVQRVSRYVARMR